MNYYNEFDPKAAAWLRELINDKLIPKGDVDTRSITDVSDSELRQDHAHASLLVQQEKIKGKQMTDTYGHISTGSLESLSLTQSLVNKLKEQLSTDGSMIYKQTWKKKATPSGIVYWAHIASTPRTSGKGCIGWLTPSTIAVNERSQESTKKRAEQRLKTGRTSLSPGNLAEQATMYCRWATPVAQPANGSPGDFLRRKQESVARGAKMGMCVSDIQMQAKLTAGYMTPKASDGQFATPRTSGRPMEKSTHLQTQIIATMSNHSSCNLPMLNGSTAETTNTGQLNPALSRWLMGYPEGWCIAAIQSSRQMKPKKRGL